MTHALVTDAQHEVAALELDLADAGPVYNKKEKKKQKHVKHHVITITADEIDRKTHLNRVCSILPLTDHQRKVQHEEKQQKIKLK
jgi:hypothetical protein